MIEIRSFSLSPLETRNDNGLLQIFVPAPTLPEQDERARDRAWREDGIIGGRVASRCEVEGEESARSLALPEENLANASISISISCPRRHAARRWTTLFSYCEIHEGAKIVF